ncbi:MAG: NUDIX domain-containing protein [Bacilli bacterium]|nr:NUDIX domain-containing protein [Bacilli bacterium]MBR3208993.1 NUDIX domain-containing protein [Bacilli bacterium]
MVTQKAGTILINIETKQIGLVYREKQKDITFPKGHLEKGETLLECALRETEEETGRKCHSYSEEEIESISYTTKKGEKCLTSMFIAIDDGKSNRIFQDEVLIWVDLDNITQALTHKNLKEFWKKNREKVERIIEKK